MAENLNDKFKQSVSQYSEKVAITYKTDDRWADITYRELYDHVAALSGFLSKKNIQRDDKVAILLKNRPEWPQVFFATLSVHAVAVPINPEAGLEEIKNILNASGAKILFTDAEISGHKKEILEKCSQMQEVVSVDSDEFKRVVERAAPLVFDEIGSNPDDLACILFTSGTTSEPKGVMLSHKNLLANCNSLYKLNLVSEKDSLFSILPLYHAYPITVTLLLMLLYGGKIVYPGTLRGEELLNAMREVNPTIFVAVPQIFYVFHEKITGALKKLPAPVYIFLNALANLLYMFRDLTGINLSRFLFYGIHRKFGKALRFFVSGGAKLDENIERDLFKLGFKILEGYGLTETAPVLTFSPLKKPKVGSVGFAIPDVELKIVGQDEKGMGEVVVRGPNIMEGYYKRDDLTHEVIKDGWFHTGDLGFCDLEGYLFLTGRCKDVIVLSSGLNVLPGEIEAAYTKEAPVEEMCVFDVTTKKGGRETPVLWAVVVPDLKFFRKYGEVNLQHVIKERFDNVSKSLPAHQRLMGFSITLEPLPHTFLGKVKRFAVKEAYAPKVLQEKSALKTDELSPEDQELLENDFSKKIIAFLKKHAGVERQIVPGDSLELDLGVDSLGRVEIASGLEQLFGVKIKDEVIGGAFTVRDLIQGCLTALLEGEGDISSAEGKKIKFDADYWKRLFEIPPDKENLAKIDLKPDFFAWLIGFIFTRLPWMYLKIFHGLKVEGKENLPQSGPVVLYANHTSYFDGFLVAVSLPRFPRLDLFFVGFRPYFNVPIIRNLIKIGRIIPLDFSTHLLEALRSCYFVLNNNKNLCLFPEGVRTLDGKMTEFKKGFGILTKVTGVKLMPIFLEGAYEAWPRTSKFPKPHPIRVKLGKVLDPNEVEQEGYKLGAKDSYEAICLGARAALAKLSEKIE